MIENTQDVFISKKNFSQHIEHFVLENPGVSYFDAVIQYAESADIDPDELVQYMNSVLIEKIKKSAVDSGMIRSTSYDLEQLMEDDS